LSVAIKSNYFQTKPPWRYTLLFSKQPQASERVALRTCPFSVTPINARDPRFAIAKSRSFSVSAGESIPNMLAARYRTRECFRSLGIFYVELSRFLSTNSSTKNMARKCLDTRPRPHLDERADLKSQFVFASALKTHRQSSAKRQSVFHLLMDAPTRSLTLD